MSLRLTQTGVQVSNWAGSLSWWKWVLAIDLVLISITTVQAWLPESLWKFYHHFDLGKEMTLATWWSMIGLLAVAFLAYEEYSTSREPTRYAWLILAVLFAGLSLDEVGSIHERMGGWEGNVPVVIVSSFPVAIAVAMLYRSSGTRKAAVWITVMFLGLGWVIIEELFGPEYGLPGWGMSIKEGLLDEGLELLAVLLGLRALVELRQRRFSDDSFRAVLANPFNVKFLSLLLLVGLILHIAGSVYVTLVFDLSGRGNPAVWFPAAVSFLLACACVYRCSMLPEGKQRIWWVLAGYFALSSAASVYLISPRVGNSMLAVFGSASNFNLLFALQFIFIAVMFALVNRRRQLYAGQIALLILLEVVLCFGFIFEGIAFRFITAGVFAYTIGNLFLIHEKRVIAVETRPVKIQSELTAR